MYKSRLKVWFVAFLLGIYFFNQIFSFLPYVPVSLAYAQDHEVLLPQEETPEKSNIIALLVEKELYDAIESDISRYVSYLRHGGNGVMSTAKVVVLPINTKNITAVNIVKMLEGLYFDGIKDHSSVLKGVILVGDIPFPVVNDNGYIFPTIYPYVDFEQQKFIWDAEMKYFVPNMQTNAQPEVFHSLITYPSVAEYHAFFDKLKQYSQSPSTYIGKRIWYEDLIANKKYFLDELQSKYINNWLFSEDIGYHRYTNLFLKIIQRINEGEIASALDGLAGVSVADTLQQTVTSVPTLIVAKTIQHSGLQPYINMWSTKYLSRIRENLQYSNRWVEHFTGLDGQEQSRLAWDSHIQKIDVKDEYFTSYASKINNIFVDLNTYLEEEINNKVEQEQYYMHIPLPLEYLKYAQDSINLLFTRINTWDTYDAYRNYYFGRDANEIFDIKDTTIYRGTFRNLTTLSGVQQQDIQSSSNPATDVEDLNLHAKSVGASYDIFSQQVQANRGFNYFSANEDIDIYQKYKIGKQSAWKMVCAGVKISGYCIGFWRWALKRGKECDVNDEEEQGDCEGPYEFAMRNWGGASVLNLESIQEKKWKQPYLYTGAVLPIYDIAGSVGVEHAISSANSFDAVKTFTNFIQQRFSSTNKSKYKYREFGRSVPNPAVSQHAYGKYAHEIKFPNLLPIGNLHSSPNYSVNSPLLYDRADFFHLCPDAEVFKEGEVLKLRKGNRDAGELWTFKTLDTRIENTNTFASDIAGKQYRKFKDPTSPEYLLHTDILGKLALLREEYRPDVSGSGALAQIQQKVNAVKTTVQEINTALDQVYTFSIDDLESYTGGQVTQLAHQWENIFDTEKALAISGQVADVKVLMQAFQEKLEQMSLDSITNILSSKIYAYAVERKTLSLREQWISKWREEITTLQQNVAGFSDAIKPIKDSYNAIGAIKQSDLLAKRYMIDEKYDCDQAPYTQLCSRLSALHTQLSTHVPVVNATIEQIGKFSFEYDDSTKEYGVRRFDHYIALALQHLGSEMRDFFNLVENKTVVSADENLVGEQSVINETTLDRPVDSPRYLTFQGVGGDVVKFIYPTLYKIEVFKDTGSGTLVLKSPAEIEQAIKHYLVQVIKKYNTYLVQQTEKKEAFYTPSASSFDKLAALHPLASPASPRSYHLFPEDFLVKKLEEKIAQAPAYRDDLGGYRPLQFLARMLYYQNLSWKERLFSDAIQEDIDLSIDAFDVNNKIIYTLAEYLKKDNNKGKFLSPEYQDTGYEVLYINSDGDDYIRSEKSESSTLAGIRAQMHAYRDQSAEVGVGGDDDISRIADACSPDEEGVLLFDIQEGNSPWAKAFKCWMDSFSEQVKLEVQWPGDPRNVFSSFTGDVYQDINQELSINQKKWKALRQEKTQNDFDDSLSEEAIQTLGGIDHNVQVQLSDTYLSTDALDTNIQLRSMKDLGKIHVKISSVGDASLGIKTIHGIKKLSDKDPFVGVFDTSRVQEFRLMFVPGGQHVGYNVLTFELCSPSVVGTCITKTKTLHITPGPVKTIKMGDVVNRVLAGSTHRIPIYGTDAYGNSVGQLVGQRYVISTDNGKVGIGAPVATGIVFSDFREDAFLYKAPKEAAGSSSHIWIRPFQDDTVIDSKTFTIVDGKLQFVMGSQTWDSTMTAPAFSYSLQEFSPYTFVDSYGIKQVNPNKLLKLRLRLVDTDGKKLTLTNPVQVSSQYGLLRPGTIVSREQTVKKDGKTLTIKRKLFAGKTVHTLKDGILTLYFLPSFRAGKELLHLSIPGVIEHTIPVELTPGDPTQTIISFDSSSIRSGERFTALVSVKDNWGNPVPDTSKVKLTPIGLEILEQQSVDGRLQLVLTDKASSPMGRGKLLGMLSHLPLFQQRPALQEIAIKRSYVPMKNLNAMYLNLFGDDRGNQRGYFSDHTGTVSRMMSNSDKLIAATTLLTHPRHLKKNIVALSTNSQITSNNHPISLMIKDQMLQYMVDGVGTLSRSRNGFALHQVADLDALEQDHRLYYLPRDLDSVITENYVRENKEIVVNGEVVFSLVDGTIPGVELRSESQTLSGYTIFELLYHGKSLGTLVVVASDLEQWTITTTSARYQVLPLWVAGTTNLSGVGIFDMDSRYAPTIKSYDAIEDSNDPTKGIGFSASFKNITHFGEGLSVGEATLPFASEFLINIGDPLVKRIDANDLLSVSISEEEKQTLDYDGGVGKVVASFPGKHIKKTVVADFTHDGEQDIVVLFRDGTVRLIKKYQGTHNYQDMGELLRISEGVEDIVAGDADGNGYADIFLFTKEQRLRVYLNDRGAIDIDGVPVCLNINVEEGQKNPRPEILDLHNIWLKDMDGDGRMDITTYDTYGFLKIVYGSSDSYISHDQYLCDDGWYQRTLSHTKYIDRFGLVLDTSKRIVDDSLVRWKGLTDTSTPSEIDPEDLGVQDEEIRAFFAQSHKKPDPEALGAFLAEKIQFDPNKAIGVYKKHVRPLVKNKVPIHPVYEQDSDQDLGYLRLWDIQDDDPVTVWKQYHTPNAMLKKGDMVRVHVTLRAKDAFLGTYSDTIKGPWKVHVAHDGGISEFAFSGRTAEEIDALAVHRNLEDMNYVIDNIQLSAGEELHWDYELEYVGGVAPLDIEIEDIDGARYQHIDSTFGAYSSDGFPDILVKLRDGCIKLLTLYMNTAAENHRSYAKKQVDVGAYLAKQAQEMNAESLKKSKETTKVLVKDLVEHNAGGVLKGGMEARKNIGLSSEDFSVENIFSEGGVDVSGLSDLGNAVVDGFLLDKVNKVDTYLDGLCKGFGGQGKRPFPTLPIPFNQALFAPGKYHLFGCMDIPPLTRTLGKGLPVLSIPGNWGPIAGVYIPAPNIFGFPLRGVEEEAYGPLGGPPTGPWSSFLRLYLIPTLTQRLALGVCFGPYSVGINIPSPIGDLGGNCIAIEIPLGKEDEKQPLDASLNPGVDGALAGLPICEQSAPPMSDSSTVSSPFTVAQGSDLSQGYIPQQYMGGMVQVPDNPFFDIDISPSTTRYSSLTLEGGALQKNKITGADVGGFVKKLVRDWFDRQTRYIVNNLTRMKLKLILPDFTTFFEGIHTMDFNLGEIDESACKDLRGKRNGEECHISQQVSCENRGGIRDSQQHTCGLGSGPNAKGFEKIATLLQNVEAKSEVMHAHTLGKMNSITENFADQFKEFPLINIRTQNLYVNIPMISAEDIKSYEIRSKAWIARQEGIIQQWEDFFEYYRGACAKQKQADPNKAPEGICKDFNATLTQFLAFKSRIMRVADRIKENTHTLNLYLRFPSQLYELIHSFDTYLSDVVTVVNSFLGTLGIWMKTNAKRFSSYVDALILIVTTLETYQILIDIPVQWKEKCGTCTVDSYDQYNCKLSFLTPKIPIVPIPPFKIPNITMDMSDINLGMDIKLPKFNFTTHPIPLPKFPDIPSPPKFGVAVKFDLDFDVPLIPSPPQLPELPSFVPDIKLKLPLLPPAPKIPKLPNSISSTLKLAKSIGKIMCIVKRKIGLVAEQALKAKVEQMTQREYPVPFRDNILDMTPSWVKKTAAFLTSDDAPLQGFDIEVRSHVNIAYDFDMVYSLFENIVNNINAVGLNLEHKIEDVSNVVDENVTSFEGSVDTREEVADQAQAGIDAIQSQGENLLPSRFGATCSGSGSEVMRPLLQQLRYDSVAYDATVAENTRNTLIHGLEQLAMERTHSDTTDKTHDLLRLLTTPLSVQGGDLDTLQSTTTQLLQEHKRALAVLATDIKDDYRAFYQGVPSRQLVAEDKNITLNTRLLAFETEGDFGNENAQGTEEPSSYVDNIQGEPSAFLKGLFVDVGNGIMASLVKSQSYAMQIRDNFSRRDMNGDGKQDILLWDDTTVYIKYHRASVGTDTLAGSDYTYAIDSQEQLQGISDRYIKIGNLRWKLYSSDDEVKNFLTNGQTFDTITFSWDNRPYHKGKPVEGYILKLNRVPDSFFDKKDRSSDYHEMLNKQYVLVLPDDVTYTGKTIVLENGAEENIADLLTGTIFHVGYYNRGDENVSLTIPQYHRERKYTKIAPLGLEDTKYVINAVFSNQVVAGSERSSDTQGPEIMGMLHRPSVGQTLSGYDILEGYLGTHYLLQVVLEDNLMLSGVKIFDDSQTLLLQKRLRTPKTLLAVEQIFSTVEKEKSYTIEATDINGNTTKTILKLQLVAPELSLDRVFSNTSLSKKTFPVTIVAKLDHDIDEGIVNFYRERGYWDLIPGTTVDYLLKPWQRIVMGGVYQFSTLVGLFDQSGEKIVTIDPSNGMIAIVDAQKNRYIKELTFTKEGPLVMIRPIEGGASHFSIALPPEQLVAINEGILEKVKLHNESFGKYNEGRALKKDNTIYMYVGQGGDISVVEPLVGRYEYNPLEQTVRYYFSNAEKNIPEGYIEVKIQDFTQRLKDVAKTLTH